MKSRDLGTRFYLKFFKSKRVRTWHRNRKQVVRSSISGRIVKIKFIIASVDILKFNIFIHKCIMVVKLNRCEVGCIVVFQVCLEVTMQSAYSNRTVHLQVQDKV